MRARAEECGIPIRSDDVGDVSQPALEGSKKEAKPNVLHQSGQPSLAYLVPNLSHVLRGSVGASIAHEWLGTPSPESAIRHDRSAYHLHSASHLQPISLNSPHLQERRDTTQSTTMQAIRAEGPRGANLKFIHIARTLLSIGFRLVENQISYCPICIRLTLCPQPCRRTCRRNKIVRDCRKRIGLFSPHRGGTTQRTFMEGVG